MQIDELKRNGMLVPASIVGRERAEHAEVYVQTWTSSQRRIRALKSLALWWGLAFVSIFIPILHFVLVPVFLGAGLIIPCVVLGKNSVILGGQGTCPYCSRPFRIARSANRWPLQDICEFCHRHVRIERQSASK